MNQTDLTYHRSILEGEWSYVQFEMNEAGDVYLACSTESTQLSVMRFDSADLTSWLPTITTTTTTSTTANQNMIDFQAVAIAIIGVVGFNVVLIVYLKRKYHG